MSFHVRNADKTVEPRLEFWISEDEGDIDLWVTGTDGRDFLLLSVSETGRLKTFQISESLQKALPGLKFSNGFIDQTRSVP